MIMIIIILFVSKMKKSHYTRLILVCTMEPLNAEIETKGIPQIWTLNFVAILCTLELKTTLN